MVESNPYAPSAASLNAPAELPGSGGPGPWREGGVLVIQHTSVMPARCVKCNEPAAEPMPARRLFWHPRGYFVLFLVSPLIYVVVALVVRRKAVVSPGLCEGHKRRRRWFLGLAWLGFLSFSAMIVAFEAVDWDRWASLEAAAFILTLICMVVGVIGSRIVFPASIDRAYVRLRGCGDPFLDSLPPFAT